MALTDIESNMLRLLLRSPDIGDGWRQVSDHLWPHISGSMSSMTGLVELDADQKRVRLSSDGRTVTSYLFGGRDDG